LLFHFVYQFPLKTIDYETESGILLFYVDGSLPTRNGRWTIIKTGFTAVASSQ
jgi:hypothetical protein